VRLSAGSRDLDLTPRARADRSGDKTGITTDERADLAALRKELRIVKHERDILGKPWPSSQRRIW
jgi:hypothetical protein